MGFGEFWRQNRWARDAVLPTLLILLTLFTSGYRFDLLSLFMVLPLYWRRRDPEVVFGVTVVLALVQLALNTSPMIGDLAIPLVVHATTAYAKDRGWGWAALGTGLVGAVLGPWRWYGIGGYSRYPDLLLLMAVAVITVVICFLIGRREVTHQNESEAANAERERLLAIDRDQRAEMTAAAERTRIARELHDIVAHSLSVVVVQADGGIAAAKSRPEVAAQVLDTIAETALADMRRLVGVLRSGAAAEDDHPDFAPAPTAADVPELVEQVRRAGQRVELVIAGDERDDRPVRPRRRTLALRQCERARHRRRHACRSPDDELPDRDAVEAEGR
jgi:signal transduction histidine kinase